MAEQVTLNHRVREAIRRMLLDKLAICGIGNVIKADVVATVFESLQFGQTFDKPRGALA
jgi:hypothetical protein